jgi:hypothetical protein
VTNAVLHGISVAVLLFIAGWLAPESLSEVSAGRDCWLDPSIGEPASDPGGVVSTVSGDCLRSFARASSG